MTKEYITNNTSIINAKLNEARMLLQSMNMLIAGKVEKFAPTTIVQIMNIKNVTISNKPEEPSPLKSLNRLSSEMSESVVSKETAKFIRVEEKLDLVKEDSRSEDSKSMNSSSIRHNVKGSSNNVISEYSNNSNSTKHKKTNKSLVCKPCRF